MFGLTKRYDLAGLGYLPMAAIRLLQRLFNVQDPISNALSLVRVHPRRPHKLA